MNILNKLINKLKNIRSSNILTLESSSFSETVKLIIIDSIEMILNDEETFNKFLDYEKNTEIFGNDTTKDDYIIAIKSYINCKIDMDEKIPKDIAKKYYIITNEKIDKNNILRNKDKKIKKLKNKVAKDILLTDELFEIFISDKKEYENINFNQLYDSTKKYIDKNIVITREDIEDEINAYLNMKDKSIGFDKKTYEKFKIIKTIKQIKNEGIKIDPNLKLSEEFESSIMNSIPKGLDDIALSRAIYIELNKRVQYSEEMSFFNQNLDLDFINNIHNKDISKVDLKDNKITCKNWSEIYSYFLEKHDIDSYIIKKGKHHHVEFILNGQVFFADATNATESDQDKNIMTDLGRAKLGLKPEGFKCIAGNEKNYDLIDKAIGYDFKPISIDNSVYNLVASIKEKNNELKEDKNVLIKQEQEKNIGILKVFFEDILEDTSNLNSLEIYSYIRNIINLIDSPFKELVSLNTSYIYADSELNGHSLVTIVPINIIEDENKEIENSQSKKESKYEYILIDVEQGIVRKTKEELLDDIKKDRYLINKNIEKDNTILGINKEELQEAKEAKEYKVEEKLDDTKDNSEYMI